MQPLANFCNNRFFNDSYSLNHPPVDERREVVIVVDVQQLQDLLKVELNDFQMNSAALDLRALTMKLNVSCQSEF